MLAVVKIALGFVVTVAGSAQAQSHSALVTWKLNVAKSHFDPGPAPKSDDRVYEAWEGDASQRRSPAWRRTVRDSRPAMPRYDGKDYKYTGSVSRDTIALTRIDANTFDAVPKKGGKVVQTTHTVISAGGKVLTLTASAGINRDGKPMNKSVTVFDRQ